MKREYMLACPRTLSEVLIARWNFFFLLVFGFLPLLCHGRGGLWPAAAAAAVLLLLLCCCCCCAAAAAAAVLLLLLLLAWFPR